MKVLPLIRIVDDDPTVAASLTFVLEVAGLQVKSYESAEQFLAYDDSSRLGCLLLDVRMGGMSGLELQNELRCRGSDLPIVFLSAHGDIEMAMACVKRGASDFLVKPPRPDKLVEALGRACGLHEQIRGLKRELEEFERESGGLSAGEMETAGLIAKGFSNRETADVLGLTEEAVKSRRGRILEKLGLRSALELSEWLHARERAAAELAALGGVRPQEDS